jgi:hypothetical protein
LGEAFLGGTSSSENGTPLQIVEKGRKKEAESLPLSPCFIPGNPGSGGASPYPVERFPISSVFEGIENEDEGGR